MKLFCNAENRAGEGTITSALALFNSDLMKKMKK